MKKIGTKVALLKNLKTSLRAVKSNPNNDDAHIQLGRAYQKLHKTSQAAKEFRTAIKINPKEASHYCDLASTYWKATQLNKRVNTFKQALKLSPSDSSISIAIGDSYRMLKYQIKPSRRLTMALKQAYRWYGNAVSLSPRDAKSLGKFGQVCNDLNRSDEAIKIFTKITKLDSKSYKGYIGLATAFSDSGNYKSAIAAYDKAIKLRPDDEHAYFMETLLHLKFGSLDKAREKYQRLRRIDRDSADILKCFCGEI